MSGYTANLKTTKSYIWLRTVDGYIQQVEEDVALFCPFIHNNMKPPWGSSKNSPIPLPVDVYPRILGLILQYCRFHHVAGRPDLERKSFDEMLMEIDKETLTDLYVAAQNMEMPPLVELAFAGLQRIHGDRTPQQIFESFGTPKEVDTQNQPFNPVIIHTDDPQARRLNKLYERKRKELKDVEEKLKNVKAEAQAPPVDDRSIDELVSFIEGDTEGPKEEELSKRKKKELKGKGKAIGM